MVMQTRGSRNCADRRSFASLLLGGVWLVVIGLGCSPAPETGSEEKPGASASESRVTVASFPLYEALQAAVGQELDLFYPQVPAGQAIDRPTVQQVQSSRLIVVDGTHHVGWVDTVSLPETRKRVSTFDIMDRLIMVENLGSHSHGPGGEHSHKGIVAQTWPDPALLKLQLQSTLQACVKAELLDAEAMQRGVERWWSQVAGLERDLQALAQASPRTVIADRAGTEYLLQRIGWQVEIQELDKLAAADLATLERELQRRLQQNPGLLIVLTQGASPRLDNLLSKLQIPTLQVDLIDGPEGGGYAKRMQDNLENLKKIGTANQ
jgi:zinc transport system substrate-binding protein